MKTLLCEAYMTLRILTLSLVLTLIVHTALAKETALSTYTEESPSLSVSVTWQRSGLTLPDSEADALVKASVDAFRTMAVQEQEAMRELRTQDPDIPQHRYEMILEGSLSNNGKVMGILWKNYQYLGGAHGNLALAANSYAASDGSPVKLNDLFGRPDKVLSLLSRLSRSRLIQRGLPGDMVEAGTAPEAENFQTFLVEKDGLTLYFSPYQVGPWSEGVVTVTLSLKDLAEAKPHLAYWQ